MCAWEWFPKRKGMVTGIIVAMIGLGSVLFFFISTKVVNPDDVHAIV
jgi:hypothetical protein